MEGRKAFGPFSKGALIIPERKQQTIELILPPSLPSPQCSHFLANLPVRILFAPDPLPLPFKTPCRPFRPGIAVPPLGERDCSPFSPAVAHAPALGTVHTRHHRLQVCLDGCHPGGVGTVGASHSRRLGGWSQVLSWEWAVARKTRTTPLATEADDRQCTTPLATGADDRQCVVAAGPLSSTVKEVGVPAHRSL